MTTEVRKREKATAKFHQPPPVIQINLGWIRTESLPIAEARDLLKQLTEALAQVPSEVQE